MLIFRVLLALSIIIRESAMSFNPRAQLQLWEKLIPKSDATMFQATKSPRQLK
jgi:hypothetical protein